MTAETRSDVLKSRMLGSLYGLAVGDALGAPYEFKRRGSYTITGEMEESYTFTHNRKPLPAGTWTDDTSTALCLAASINEYDGLNWEDSAKKMTRWHSEGYMSAIGYCFDIGNATSDALHRYEVHFEYHNDKPLRFMGSSERGASGNGSLMRLAPIPVFYHYDTALAWKNSDIQSRVTHGSSLAIEACQLAAMIIVGFLNESDQSSADIRKKNVLSSSGQLSGLHFENAEVAEIWAGGFKNKSEGDISTSGFVIHSLDAALWALWKYESFEEGMRKLMTMGSDVDTVCAIYGQIAGACYGMEAIPERWLNSLQKKEVLNEVFGTLVHKAIMKGQKASLADVTG